jgi:two-component system KDP operon response regulator KdpE
VKILIADDDPQILRALRITLSARGYDVLTASDGREALRLAADGHPDIIVVDLGMPGLTGIEVIEGVRGWSAVPILVVSGRNDSFDKVEALDAGADDYVTKPFAAAELLARVRAALRRGVIGESHSASIALGAITVDLAKREVHGGDVHLTPLEPSRMSVPEWQRAAHELQTTLAGQSAMNLPYEVLVNALAV